MHWIEALSSFYLLNWFSAEIDPATIVRTLLLINTCNATMCRLFAHNNGYHKNRWTVLGFVFGIWAVAILIVLPKREG
jgi:hypothetical protein